MKMIRAIVRPDAADSVADGLAEAGFFSMTKLSAFGRGKQKGITVGAIHYDELPKAVETFRQSAKQRLRTLAEMRTNRGAKSRQDAGAHEPGK